MMSGRVFLNLVTKTFRQVLKEVREELMPAAEEETQLSTETMVRPVGEGVDISPVAEEGEEAVGVVVTMEEREDQLET